MDDRSSADEPSASGRDGGWVNDIVVGALGRGVNITTLVLLNVVVGCALGSILLLLAISVYGNPELVPHVLVLLVLGLCLWASLNWFISEMGLVDARTQEEELFGTNSTARAVGESEAAVGGSNGTTGVGTGGGGGLVGSVGGEAGEVKKER
ncbi:hypothetical protein FOA52_009455 [Chlamydomonas sp. UWO 241]|nr:hypothetical protein FOA52_009455 [Chlamydomonas sp. UWO 241]